MLFWPLEWSLSAFFAVGFATGLLLTWRGALPVALVLYFVAPVAEIAYFLIKHPTQSWAVIYVAMGLFTWLPIVGAAFGVGVALGQVLRIQTTGHPWRRLLTAAGVAAVVAVIIAIPFRREAALAAWLEASEAPAATFLRQDSEVVSKIGRVLTVRVNGKSIQGTRRQPSIFYSYYVEGVEGWGTVSVTITGSRDAPVYAISRIDTKR
jgi:hypothetical protein